MPILYDVILVAIVIWAIAHFANRGFVRTVLSFLGYLISGFIASTLSQLGARWVFHEFARPWLISYIDENILPSVGVAGAADAVGQFADSLPGIVGNVVRFGLDANPGALQQINDSLQTSVQNIGPAIADYLCAPVVLSLLRIVLFFVLFGLCLALVRNIARLCGFISKIPLLGGVNSLLGGALGFFQGILVIYLLAILLGLAVLMTNNQIPFVNEEVIQSTFIFKIFYNFNPFVNLKMLQ